MLYKVTVHTEQNVRAMYISLVLSVVARKMSFRLKWLTQLLFILPLLN
jgi:hypothetical protein